MEGLKHIEETPDLSSMLYVGVYDLDVAGAYPNGEDILNASRETTVAEVVKIKGVNNTAQRYAGLNLTAGVVNATEIMQSVCKAPSFFELLDDFQMNELQTLEHED